MVNLHGQSEGHAELDQCDEGKERRDDPSPITDEVDSMDKEQLDGYGDHPTVPTSI